MASSARSSRTCWARFGGGTLIQVIVIDVGLADPRGRAPPGEYSRAYQLILEQTVVYTLLRTAMTQPSSSFSKATNLRTSETLLACKAPIRDKKEAL